MKKKKTYKAMKTRTKTKNPFKYEKLYTHLICFDGFKTTNYLSISVHIKNLIKFQI